MTVATDRIRLEGWAHIKANQKLADLAEEIRPQAAKIVGDVDALLEPYPHLYASYLMANGSAAFRIDAFPSPSLVRVVASLQCAKEPAAFRVSGDRKLFRTPESRKLKKGSGKIRAATTRLGNLALERLDVGPVQSLDRQNDSDIEVGLLRYGPNVDLTSSEGGVHRDDFPIGSVVVSLSMGPGEREWSIGPDKQNLASVDQSSADIVWLESRTAKTNSPNPFHGVHNSSDQNTYALLFVAKPAAAERFDHLFT